MRPNNPSRSTSTISSGSIIETCSASFLAFLLVPRLPLMERKPCLQQALNNRMNRLGGATIGLGLFSMAMVSAGTFWLVGIWCFLQVM